MKKKQKKSKKTRKSKKKIQKLKNLNNPKIHLKVKKEVLKKNQEKKRLEK